MTIKEVARKLPKRVKLIILFIKLIFVKEFRLFKIIEKGNQKPIKILTPTEKQAESIAETKVVLLSDSKDVSTVAEAILIENETFKDKKDLSKLLKSEISDRFESFNIQDDEMNGEFVYDVYRLDLGRFTSKDIEGKANCIEIVPYEQEFLTDEEGSESEVYEDDNDSNGKENKPFFRFLNIFYSRGLLC